MKYVFKKIESPVGVLTAIASERGLAAILWPNDSPRRVPLAALATEDARHPVLLETERQLTSYFAGKLRRFTVKLDFSGTEFQKSVWRALLEIPFGETRSYGDLAKRLRRPSAARAVGMANGKNPVSIVVPCHRVIGASGKLTGFAGGLAVKAKLLELEKSVRGARA